MKMPKLEIPMLAVLRRRWSVAFRGAVLGAVLGAVAAVLSVGAPDAAEAGSSQWERTEFADVRLVSAVSGTEGRDTVPLGLEFRLAEGWKVYWRAPGDAGYPPDLTWDGSDNLSAAEMRFPVPERFSIFGLESYGYADAVVYPITANLARSGEPMRVVAEVNALACAEICVPLTASLSLDLPATAPAATPFTQLIGRWQARVPSDLSGIGLSVERAVATGDAAHPTLELSVRSTEPLGPLDVFPEAESAFSFGKPEISTAADGRSALVRVPVGSRDGVALNGKSVTLTLVDGDRFVERSVIVGETGAAIGSNTASGPVSIAWILVLAVLGGLILNLMPCVLPVLSIKLMGVVSYGGAETRAIRAGFLASAAGIVVSFLLLAGGAVALKLGGVAVGWGIQFQQPVFLAVMAAIVTLFAANLAGGFEIPLPRAFARLGEGRPGQPAGSGGLTGHFGTGVLATLLATPCSAPFVGTAIGFALARGPFEIVAVFAAMGVGLALPYLLVAAAPGIARSIPRPGPWMVWVKRVMALALLATAAWLVSVIAAQAGGSSALLVGFGLLVAFALLVSLVRFGRAGPRKAVGGVATLALVLAIVASGLGDRVSGMTGPVSTDAKVAWEPFDRAALSSRIASGEVILVDVTADWCITCKVNKRLVLESGAVAKLLSGGAVTPLKADWTNPDPVISDYLASFGRYGIPFNVVYGPDAPEGIPLPELLGEDVVLEAISRAGGAPAPSPTPSADTAPSAPPLDKSG
jgi:suppressor for copper-sensitivity B